MIDAHIHFWNYNPVRDAWITNDMNVIQRDFLPADVQGIFTENNIHGCVAVQADQSPAETDFLLKLAAENDFIKGVSGWIDLTAADIEQQLDAYKNEQKLKGFRHIAEGEPEGFLLRKDVLNSISHIGRHGYAYDILVKQHQLNDALSLSEKLPGQRLIIDHCAKPALRTGNLSTWKQQMKELALNPDIYCKLSGLLTEDHWHNCNEKQLKDCLDVIFENFGTNKILFGSDWPVMLLAGHYTQWKNLVQQYTSQFSQKEQDAVFSSNAITFYNL
ncbi:amidohydrolase [Flavobacterium akiainvivens]|uniref:Amidohydrolase n=1 Tax=Flavobacterium akiainvivens TaxID=1202724 RepID=A0A0M8MKV5_9FLAO|nr:amidohydrolase [Flavobacterium akiainvivens]